MTSNSLNTCEFQHELFLFNGSGKSYSDRALVVGRVEYTDGIRFLQQNGCCWLIDAIASYQTHEFKLADECQFWKLSVDLETQQAKLICDDGNGNIRITQEIDYTDFPLSKLDIYVEIRDCVFMCLMSEY
jgi:hypothetical protein